MEESTGKAVAVALVCLFVEKHQGRVSDEWLVEPIFIEAVSPVYNQNPIKNATPQVKQTFGCLIKILCGLKIV